MSRTADATEKVRVAIEQFAEAWGLTFDEAMDAIIKGHTAYLNGENDCEITAVEG